MDGEGTSMKKLKEEVNMIYYIADAEYGIPKRCPCGAMIKEEIAPEESYDHLPGKRFFTCRQYKPDGLHFRQPWVAGIKEEIDRLTKRIEDIEKTIKEYQQLRVHVHNLTLRVEELERGV